MVSRLRRVVGKAIKLKPGPLRHLALTGTAGHEHMVMVRAGSASGVGGRWGLVKLLDSAAVSLQRRRKISQVLECDAQGIGWLERSRLLEGFDHRCSCSVRP